MTETEINQLKDLRSELSSSKKKILALQAEMKQLEETIYSKCEHKWEIDRTNVGEHTEYICLKCQLSKK
jgi:uncharacterized protein YlxW (UPF0749 family)